MLTTNKYQFIALNQAIAYKYQQLTYPHFQSLLSNLTAEASVIAIGVELEEKPIGMILARYSQSPEEDNQIYGQILSVFVVPSYRCQGIGKELLIRMENEFKHRGCAQIELNYLDNSSSIALEQIFTKLNWSTPEATALVCYATTANVENTKQPHLTQYLNRLLAHIPHDYTIFAWHTLTANSKGFFGSKI